MQIYVATTIVCVKVIITENEIGELSSNPGQSNLSFTLY